MASMSSGTAGYDFQSASKGTGLDMNSFFKQSESMIGKYMDLGLKTDSTTRQRDREDFSFYSQGYQKERAAEDTRRFELGEKGADSGLRRQKDVMGTQEGIDTRARRQSTDLANERAAFDEGLLAKTDVRRAQLDRGTMRLDQQLKQMGKDKDLQRALSILPRR